MHNVLQLFRDVTTQTYKDTVWWNFDVFFVLVLSKQEKWTHPVAEDTWSARTGFITLLRWRWECLDLRPVGERFMISRHPRTNKKGRNNTLYITLIPLSHSLSFPSLFLGNLKRVSNTTTCSSEGLLLMKQRHLITAEATNVLCVSWAKVKKADF